MNKQSILALGILFTVFLSGVQTLRAFTATSTTFLIRQAILGPSGGNSTYSFSTSTSFKLVGAGAENALGTSTSSTFGIRSGFLHTLYASSSPQYVQIHYHWRNDNGSESTATSGTGGTEDTSTSSVPKLVSKRLRLEISNEGGTQASYSSQQFRLEYGIKSSVCSAISSWVDVGAVGGDFDMYDSSNLTDGANTTNISVSTGGVSDANNTFLSSNGGVKDTGSQTSAVSVSSVNFIELEYSIQALAAASDGGTYCFRVTNANSTNNFTYSVYPEATITGSSLMVVIDSATKSFGIHTPGTLSVATSSITITTSNSTGFSVSVSRDDADTALDLDSNAAVNITDKTAWNAGVATTSAGNATASTTEPSTLQFRVRFAGTDTPNYAGSWWGINDTTASALFAGFPFGNEQIANRSTAAAGGTAVYTLYNLNTPITQATGDYSGSITYTIVVNP